MTCNKHLGVTVRVRKCNNTSNEKNNRIRGQSKFVCVCVCVYSRCTASSNTYKFLGSEQQFTLNNFSAAQNFPLFTEFHYCDCKSPSLVSILK